MEPEGSLPLSQEPATCPYSEPEKSSPCNHPTSWRSIVTLSSHLCPGLPSGVLSSAFPTKTLYTPLLSPTRVTCSSHFIILDLITRITFGEEYMQVTKLLILEFSQYPCYIVPLRLKYSPQQPILKRFQPMFLPQGSGVPRNFLRGGVQQIQLRTEDREEGDLGAVAP